ncbi:hypothetical protein [Sphingopyxis terrae]|uniref:hypothetical protein n=1 Tax=Sphingopyxis terrae TaxID=33052 RepID=UPI001C2C679D|nr:hypothetical protein [Sphingopyxis terrae]QXF11103.1 hypothetical protein HBA51_02215 [Sphingopyxis terrae subsp. terrae]
MNENRVPGEDQLDAIRHLCAGEVSYRTDGWRHLIHMEGLRFKANGENREMDAVLVLNHDNATYPTKLYLTENVGCGLNWNESAYILGMNWHTYSWANVPSDLTPFEILANHLAPMAMQTAA